MPSTSLDRLQTLHAVCTTGTIAAAARQLGYTPSAVSQRLAELEREAGVALLERSNRGVAPTAAGRRLAERASMILDLVQSAFDEVALAGAGGTPSTVVIAAFPTAISSMLLPALDRLPNTVRLRIVALEPEQALQALVGRTVDAAIVDSYAELPTLLPNGLRSVELCREPIQLVTDRHRRPRSLVACKDADWVLGPPTSRLGMTARSLCQRHGFVPNVIAEADDHHVTFDIVRATGAVSLLPQLALADVPPGIRFARSVATGAERCIDLLTRHLPRPNTAVAIVEEVIRSTNT